jgi:hypothetical protein
MPGMDFSNGRVERFHPAQYAARPKPPG